MPIDVILFDPVKHVYSLNGLIVPSVTQILSNVGKRPDFSRVDPEVLEAKRQLGTLVHEACMVLAEGDDLDWEALGLGEGYVRGFKKFLVDTRFKVERMEWHTICRVDGIPYGMKIDIAGLWNGEPYLGEIKTPEKAENWWRLQTAGYQLGLEATLGRPHVPPFRYRRFVCHLGRSGYSVITHNEESDLEAFRCALKLAGWE